MENTENTTKIGPTRSKTITARSKAYKFNANVVGWHVHTQDEYMGYYSFTLDSIVKSETLNVRGERLVWIGGNVLQFQR